MFDYFEDFRNILFFSMTAFFIVMMVRGVF